jgi:pimeloyl-ACP methyl ester carboxylesterase
MTTPRDVRIPAGPDQIAAYLYVPDGPGPTGTGRPCIVMAHGFTATRDDGLPAYAEAFCEAGYVVVVFDYRGFGASTGTPRQLLDIAMQHADYHTVVAWARHLDGVDPDRIVVWGSSFSGGHVLAVAAEDPRIAAVISQAPFTDGIATLRAQPLSFVPKGLAAGLRDQIGAWRGQPPHLMAAVGDPGTVAAMTSPDAKPGFEAIVGPKSLWRNEFSARVALRLGFYRPGIVTGRLAMPLLVCVCENDAVTPPGPTIAAAQRAPRGELRRYPYGHFDIYRDPQVKADQLAFLRRVFADVAA